LEYRPLQSDAPTEMVDLLEKVVRAFREWTVPAARVRVNTADGGL